MDSSVAFSIGFLGLFFSIIGGLIIKLWYDEKNATKRRQALLSMGVENDDVEEIRPQQRRRQRVNHEDEEEDYEINEDEKKIGKKKLAKLQAKAQAKAQREAEQSERLERKKQEEERTRIEDEKRKAEEEEERKHLEKMKAEREERKRKEQEEYNKLKLAFNVEEQGFDHAEELQSENMIQAFLEHIKNTKVIYIDELSAKFSLSLDETVNRINQFISDKLINGVFDDRGKFICITNDELKAVVKFINQRGRITIQELVEHSNRLISLESTNVAASPIQENLSTSTVLVNK